MSESQIAPRKQHEPMVSVTERFIVPEAAFEGVLDTLCDAVLAVGGSVRGGTVVTLLTADTESVSS